MHAYEMHAREVYAHEIHAHEIHAHETHAYEIIAEESEMKSVLKDIIKEIGSGGEVNPRVYPG